MADGLKRPIARSKTVHVDVQNGPLVYRSKTAQRSVPKWPTFVCGNLVTHDLWAVLGSGPSAVLVIHKIYGRFVGLGLFGPYAVLVFSPFGRHGSDVWVESQPQTNFGPSPLRLYMEDRALASRLPPRPPLSIASPVVTQAPSPIAVPRPRLVTPPVIALDDMQQPQPQPQPQPPTLAD